MKTTQHLLKYRTLILATILLFAGCQPRDTNTCHRGIYHWKTTYNPSEWEKRWMKEHRVGKLYVKLFEVDAGNKHGHDAWRMVPVATTRFQQPLPKEMEVVPVVYITVDAIRALKNGEYMEWTTKERYAELLVKRIKEMMAEHYEGRVREVQLDCDWTAQTEETYFDLVRSIKTMLHNDSITLSGTLRLHQLRQVEERTGYSDTIPFDRSLLMCYNTGNLHDPRTENSILDYDCAKPYLKQYQSSTLPRTDVAYPVYGWGVEFDRTGQFDRLITSDKMPHHSTETIRIEWGDMREIRRTQQALPTLDSLHTTILYHLDSLNLSHYSHEDIEAIYSR